MRECLSPADMKALAQQSFLLWQQHGELEHQLALLVYKLGERCSLYSRWEIRAERLLTWMRDAEARLQADATGLDEPEEVLRKLECELQAEMALKQRELDWLRNNGKELMENALESDERDRLLVTLDEMSERWNALTTASKARANKIIDLVQTAATLQRRLTEIRVWLGTLEAQLSEPYTIESTNSTIMERKLEDHELLQKKIEAESGNVGEVLNLCEILLSDCDAWKASLDTDSIKNSMKGLERRWKSTCVKSSERKRKIILTGKLLEELVSLTNEYEDWLVTVERQIEELQTSLRDLSKDCSEKTKRQSEKILEDIKAHQPALQILEQCYSRLAKGGLEPDNLKSLTANTRQLIDR